MLKYIVILVLLILISGLFIIIDSFLKESEEEQQTVEAADPESGFKLRQVYWMVLVPLLLVLLITFAWCFYFKFIKDFI